MPVALAAGGRAGAPGGTTARLVPRGDAGATPCDAAAAPAACGKTARAPETDRRGTYVPVGKR